MIQPFIAKYIKPYNHVKNLDYGIGIVYYILPYFKCTLGDLFWTSDGLENQKFKTACNKCFKITTRHPWKFLSIGLIITVTTINLITI